MTSSPSGHVLIAGNFSSILVGLVSRLLSSRHLHDEEGYSSSRPGYPRIPSELF